ncbi:MAG: nucleotidyl transferase AbiEii/AbiGii toxin family protein [Deltaproteobacteria bacterium]|nr:nucleotidyl transferase AbiEii/AbiGii toxin family protein [Deltaproteobacteria bacterium]
MTKRSVVDTAASVRQRLLNIARDKGRPFNEVLQYFAMERFLYRLGKSDHGRKFILKGALMLVAWEAPLARSTKDIDLLGRMNNTIEDVVDAIKVVCSLEVIPDGMLFDVKSVVGQRIAEEADYEGVRVRFRGTLGNARITMQVDVGFGDAVIPGPAEVDYPTLLDLPAPRLLGYSQESAIAEKFETMVKLGILNSRMRDFFDIWLLSRQFEFNGQTLSDAIRETFTRRGTEVYVSPVALTKAFSDDPGKISQWRAFVRKSRIPTIPESLGDAVAHIALFLGPMAEALSRENPFFGNWHPPGPWIAGKRRSRNDSG